MITNEPFTNDINGKTTLINMSRVAGHEVEHHIHTNNSSGTHLVHISTDSVDSNATDAYTVQLLTEQSTTYSSSQKSFQISADVVDTDTHFRLEDSGSAILSTNSLLQTNSTVMKVTSSTNSNSEFVKIRSQFDAPMNENYPMTEAQPNVQLNANLLAANPENAYCIVRTSGNTLYCYPRGNPLNLNALDYVAIKEGDSMRFGIYRISSVSQSGFVGSSPVFNTDMIEIAHTNLFGTTDSVPDVEYSSGGNNDASAYKQFGLYKYDATSFRLEHPDNANIMETTSNAVFANPTLNSIELPIARPYLRVVDENLVAIHDEIMRVVKVLQTRTSHPADATELLESAWQGKILLERAARGTTKNLSDYLHLDPDSQKATYNSRIYDVQFATDYVFQVMRNVGQSLGMTSSVGSAYNWDADTTSLEVFNRNKELFAEFPVKAYGKGSNRICQNLAIGTGVKLYGKLIQNSLFSTTLSGFVISIQ